jgi:cytoskeletal protein RodZ
MDRGTSPLEQEQGIKLEELGFQLRQLREKKMLSIDQIAARTMIQPRLLLAIESGNTSILPEAVYVRGFLKRYADALGLNGTEFVSSFPLEPDMRSINPSWQESPAAQLRPMHLYVAYAALIAAAIGGLSYLLSRSAPAPSAVKSPPAVTTPATTAPSPRPAAIASSGTASSGTASPGAASPQPAVSPSPSPDTTGKAIRVNVSLTSRSWLRVVVDGKTDFEGILEQGTQRTWTADRELRVRAGDAGAVMVTYNDDQPKQMGKAGSVQQVIFSPPTSGASASLPSTP